VAANQLAYVLRLDLETTNLSVLLEEADRDAEQAFARLDSVLADLECHCLGACYVSQHHLAERQPDQIASTCERLFSEFDHLLEIAREQLTDLEQPI
jgi:hypothetical protein